MDAEDDGFATGITASLAKNGENSATANLPMGGFAHTGVADPTARDQYATVNDIQDGSYVYAVDSGAADAYVVSLSPVMTGTPGGRMVSFRATNANTGASTLNIDSTGAITIKKHDDQDLISGDIEAGQIVTVVYDNTDNTYKMISHLGNAPGDMLNANNLSNLASASTARSNLGLGTAAVVNTGTSGANVPTVTNADTLYLAQGKETIWVPSAAMKAATTNGASTLTSVETTATRPDLVVADFDYTADEFVQFSVAFPKSWDGAAVTFQAYWTVSFASTSGIAMALQGLMQEDNESIDTAYGTAVVVTDDAQGATEELLITAASGNVDLASTSGFTNGLAFFQLFRDVSNGNDDFVQDMRLIGIKIFFTTNAKDDT